MNNIKFSVYVENFVWGYMHGKEDKYIFKYEKVYIRRRWHNDLLF